MAKVERQCPFKYIEQLLRRIIYAWEGGEYMLLFGSIYVKMDYILLRVAYIIYAYAGIPYRNG